MSLGWDLKNYTPRPVRETRGAREDGLPLLEERANGYGWLCSAATLSG